VTYSIQDQADRAAALRALAQENQDLGLYEIHKTLCSSYRALNPRAVAGPLNGTEQCAEAITTCATAVATTLPTNEQNELDACEWLRLLSLAGTVKVST